MGDHPYFPDRVDDYPPKDPLYFHAVAVARGQAFDWTRRQLAPRAAHPFVQPVADRRRDWIRLGHSPEALGL
ncbi:hypothetical protein [Bradyrhizobium sp. 187]|uniref:hypothetical protein n=1 Tax=Bradyrhizobium sp. 187 TaxID=2782655 RepID=UPI001FFEF179|nr:hypothetical protein [Bradyrhizobium sp. 187]UPJ76162.1 hypothetical protein IVB19_17395 [Bradyrhizobium sp. 187]